MFLKFSICSPTCSQLQFIFYSILFGHGSRSLYISCKRGGGKHDKACFYFGEGSIFRLLYWGVSTILVMGQSNGSFWRKKRNHGHSPHSLIEAWIGTIFFARGIRPCQIWWKISWQKRFDATNGKAQACTQGALLFFLLGSQCVPNMFTKFPICSSTCSPSSQCAAQHVLHSTSLLSHMHWQMLSSFHLCRWAKGEELYTSKESLLFWKALIVSFVF
jgi:hypothetical protein